MFLITTIAGISLLLTFAHDIVKLLHIGKWIASLTSFQNVELLEQLEKAKADLDAVKNGPSSGEYALLVKTMRAEQKIKDIEQKLNGDRSMKRLKSSSIELIAGYFLKTILSLVLIGFSVSYRYTPVLVFDERFNFTPFGTLLSFPTGVHNAISVPVWVLSCNVSFGKIFSCVKRKK